MKKYFVAVLLIILISNHNFGEDKKGTVNTLDEKIKEKLQAIEKSDKKGKVFEREITKEEILRKSGKTEEAKETKYQENAMLNLTILNIVSGIFEGAAIGAGCGLIGYSQLKNKDTTPLINGAIAGSISGAILGASLSLFQYATEKYYASEDMGLNLIIYSFTGGLLGLTGGVISYGKTKDTENLSEGIGYGIAIGSFCGLIMGFVETFGPEKLRQRKFESESKGRAFNIFYDNEKILAFYNFKY